MATCGSLKCIRGSRETRLRKDSQHVVKSLTEDLKGQNCHVYFDNFFNSFELLNDLVSDDIFACGTARSNRRGFPERLKKVKFANRYT